MVNKWGNLGNNEKIYFLGLQNHCRWWPQPWNKKMLASWKKSYDQPKQLIKKQKHYFANKVPSSQSYGFSSSHVWMWELNHKESWVPKNWCFWTVVLKKTLESPLACKEIGAVNPKGNQSWIFIGRTDAEAETPVLRPPDAKNWLLGKDPDAGKDWKQEKGTTEHEMVGWHHRLDGHEFEQAPGVGVGAGRKPGVLHSVVSQRVRHDWTTELNTNLKISKEGGMWSLNQKLYLCLFCPHTIVAQWLLVQALQTENQGSHPSSLHLHKIHISSVMLLKLSHRFSCFPWSKNPFVTLWI